MIFACVDGPFAGREFPEKEGRSSPPPRIWVRTDRYDAGDIDHLTLYLLIHSPQSAKHSMEALAERFTYRMATAAERWMQDKYPDIDLEAKHVR